MVRSVGLANAKHWRMPFNDGLHLEEYPDRYIAHVDRVNPHIDPVGHLTEDLHALEAAVFGALLGKLIDQPVLGAFVGGAIGAMIPKQTRCGNVARP